MTDSPQMLTFGVAMPPTQTELPCDDGEPMETQRHKLQMDLLIDALIPWLDDREDGYVGGNMFVYYSLAQVRNRDFKGPDFFAVLGVPKGERRSWVCWEEGKTPDVVIELLSESTAEVDKTDKKRIYQNQMHVPEYFWFDPFNPDDWTGFQLQSGYYQEVAPNDHGQLISQILDLALVRWQGSYKGVETLWLRWAQRDGTVLPTPAEAERKRAEAERQCAETERQRAETERQRAEAERQRAEAERQRAEQAEAQVQEIAKNLLRSQIPIAQVAQLTGLSTAQVEAL